MKWDPGKAFPHPVLRPDQGGEGDYPTAEFEADVEAVRAKGAMAVDVSVDFELSDADLRSLVGRGEAECVLLVEAPTTRFRRLLRATRYRLQESFRAGELKGRVEFRPFLVCLRSLVGFKAAGWHADYGKRSFDLYPGSVLAQDEPAAYWIDTEDEKPIGSIFKHTATNRQADGTWVCDMSGDQVAVQMSERDHGRFEEAGRREQDDAALLINSIYLPALVHVLSEADQSEREYSGYRWFSTLDQKLEELGCSPLGKGAPDRLADAQKLLNSPLGRLPQFTDNDSEPTT
ncbi:MAG: hypothetical protein OXH70_20350 [Acidobacteria bacterium]|nr:hypothetical protein [Acidobacteriota bacterium]